MSDKDSEMLEKFLKDTKGDHYNFEEAIDYRASSGSLQLDLNLNGGFGPGLHRFVGMNEGGKEQKVSAPVLTPDGWRKIGDLKVGDSVIDSEGKTQKVLGVFPQGVKDDYEVEFDDGSKVNCGIEHLWETSSFTERHSKKRNTSSVKNLEYILDTIKYFNNLNHSVRLPKPILFKEKKLIIDPYLLGILIGDGCLRGSVTIANVDSEIWEKINTTIKVYYNNEAKLSRRDDISNSIVFPNKKENPLITELKKLNLFNKKSNEKFIPEEFLFGSVNQREDLLQGLIDTDGYINPKKSEIFYHTCSELLACNVVDLVRSLGGLARKRFQKTSYKNKDGKRVICQDCYIVSFRLPESIKPCSLDRKLLNYKPRKINFCHFIKSIKKVGQEESVCIRVSSPDSLYITSDYVLTHNTSASLEVMKNMLNDIPKSKGFYIKAEGRLSNEMQARSGVKFVFDPKEWVEGTCFVFESNIYEVVVEAMHKLVEQNEEKFKYCFLLDSVDGLISKQDIDKSFYDSNKVAGGAVIAANFMKRMSIKLAKRGHMAIFISQVRADIKLDPYSKAPIRQTSATGGNALLHFANYIIEFEPRFKTDMILLDDKAKPDLQKNPILGHWAKATIKKSPNEKTNHTITYPIRYGRTGGKSVWVEKELVDLLYIWEFINKKASWVTLVDEFRELIADYMDGEVPEKIQGEANLFKMIEENEKLSQFLISYFKSNINQSV